METAEEGSTNSTRSIYIEDYGWERWAVLERDGFTIHESHLKWSNTITYIFMDYDGTGVTWPNSNLDTIN